jgi:hypothetical protein
MHEVFQATPTYIKGPMKSFLLTEATMGGLHLHSPLRIHVHAANVRRPGWLSFLIFLVGIVQGPREPTETAINHFG